MRMSAFANIIALAILMPSSPAARSSISPSKSENGVE
jgi:hypothetical protein